MERTECRPEANYFFDSERITQKHIRDAYMSDESITGKVIGYDDIKKTVKVMLADDIVGILPWSEATIYQFTYPKMFEVSHIPRQIIALLNKTIRVKIMGIVKGKIYLSRRKNMNEALETILKEKSKVREAVIVGKCKYGVFFDIGHGITAYCTTKDFSSARISNISIWASLGERHKVIITGDCDFKDNFKISCNRKDASTRDYNYYKSKKIITVKMADPIIKDGIITGYFAEVSPKVSGIVDIVNETNGFKSGDIVTVLVKSVDPENKKMKMKAIL